MNKMNNITERMIPFSPPDITEYEIEEVCEALRSSWITTGKRTKEFETRIAAFCGTEKAVCLNSATAAEELTLRLLGIGEGDEVIVPAYTYTASASVVYHVGAKIVLVDCAADSFEMNYDAVERAITPRTKAIIPVDIGGCLCNYSRLYDIVERKRSLFCPSDNPIQKQLGRIAILADSAHGFGAEQNGKRSGAVADFTTFSFHAVKNLTTGEGGAVTWRNIDGIDNSDIYRQYMLYSLHGQTKDALEKSHAWNWEYDIVCLGYKCNMTDYTAAIGLRQLDRYPALLERRHEIIRQYNDAFLPYGAEVLPHITENGRSSGHLYMMRVPVITVEERNQWIVSLGEKGICANVHYKPLPMLTAYQKIGFDIRDYPVAYEHYSRESTLPLHTRLSDDDVMYVTDAVRALLKNRK